VHDIFISKQQKEKLQVARFITRNELISSHLQGNTKPPLPLLICLLVPTRLEIGFWMDHNSCAVSGPERVLPVDW
jgi:hypothetical protein